MTTQSHLSYWRMGNTHQSLESAGTLPQKADVAIVGGGISGLTAAVLLARAGKSVVVLEMAATVGAGDTGQTTAHITAVPDSGYSDVAQKFGQDGAALAAQAHLAAIDTIEKLAASCKIACDFTRVPFYMYATTDDQAKELKDELDAMVAAGLDAKPCDDVPMPFDIKAGLTLSNQAQFDPLKYLSGLVAEIHKHQGVVCTNTRMQSISAVDGGHKLETNRGELVVHDVILATHTPPNRLVLQLSLEPQRTYAMTFKGGSLPPRGLFYDMEEPYHYVRRHPGPGGDVLIVGGYDHRSGDGTDTTEPYAKLEAWTREHFDVTDRVAQWSGQVFEPVDGLPLVGANPGADHSWVITGLSGNGMASGTLGAVLCSDLVLGKKTAWAELFSPSRIKPVAQAKDLAKHAASVGGYMVADRVKAWLSQKPVGPHEGAVMREGAHTVAAYNDGTQVHVLSPVCPHAGCYVKFNRAEECWDCPCHGSRFAGDGKLLSGPAVSDLSPIEH
jgi:glycine/D-amino acid oxidase-like deaminating enzyme/nitrite reductase/ring-hydroxylating ferredoxin subunit